MLCISQNGGSWFGLETDPSNSSAVGNGEEACGKGENMGRTVSRSVAQDFDW